MKITTMNRSPVQLANANAKAHVKAHVKANARAIQTQKGVGLIEVLAAVFIMTIGVLAIAHLQTASLVASKNSADFFEINELSHKILEQLKADRSNAAKGAYNFSFGDSTGGGGNADIVQNVGAWNTEMGLIVHQGQVSVDCDTEECQVSLRWNETSHDGEGQEVFNLKSPI
jgi:type IV pilus assembly protein PilV